MNPSIPIVAIGVLVAVLVLGVLVVLNRNIGPDGVAIKVLNAVAFLGLLGCGGAAAVQWYLGHTSHAYWLGGLAAACLIVLLFVAPAKTAY